jgi:hypothetical protein
MPHIELKVCQLAYVLGDGRVGKGVSWDLSCVERVHGAVSDINSTGLTSVFSHAQVGGAGDWLSQAKGTASLLGR